MGNEKDELQQKYETAQAFFDKKDYKNAFNLFIKLQFLINIKRK